MSENEASFPASKPLPSWAAPVALWIIGLFPVVSFSFNHGGSTLYGLLLIVALFFAWPEWRYLERQEKLLVLGYVLLFAVAVLSFIHVQDWGNSFRRLARIFRIATLGIMFLFLHRARVEPGKALLLGLCAAVISAVFQVWYGTTFEHINRIVGLYNPEIFGDMSVLLAALLVAAIATVIHDWRLRVCISILALLALYAAARSLTRGAWIYVPVAGAILFWCFRATLLGKKRELAVILGLVIFLGVWIGHSDHGSVNNRIKQTVTSMKTFVRNPAVSTSVGERLNLWRNSVLIWENHPIIGTGIGDFKRDNQQLIAEGRSINTSIGVYGHAHNIYFDSLATMGLIGLVTVIVAIVVLPFRFFLCHWRRAKEEWLRFYALAGMLTVAGFATFGLTEHWLGRNPFVNPYIFYVLTFAISLSVRNLKGTDSSNRTSVAATEGTE